MTDPAALIPHAGRMCLLDSVTAWDADHLTATASSHRDGNNPLMRHGRLGSLCGVEYVAQAMAAHGRLTGAVSAKPKQGFLIGLREVSCSVAALQSIAGNLTVAVEKLMGDEAQVIYHFAVSGDDKLLLKGRATVILHSEET